jgi:hypothetical protein
MGTIMTDDEARAREISAIITANRAEVQEKFDRIASNLVELERRREKIADTLAYLAEVTAPDGDIAIALELLATLLSPDKPNPDAFALATWRQITDQARLELTRSAAVIGITQQKIGGTNANVSPRL